MLLISPSKMNRKPVALAILLFLAGLAPATPVIGFCTRMPCCSQAADTAAFATERTDCCTTITCYDSPSAKLTSGAPSADAVLATPALVAVSPAPVVPPLTREVVDTSPPATARQRLAALSTLLI